MCSCIQQHVSQGKDPLAKDLPIQAVFALTHLPEASKTGFGQEKIMKEYFE